MGTDSTDRRGKYESIDPSEVRAEQYPDPKIRVIEVPVAFTSAVDQALGL
jgi:hypothetical protein